MCLFSFPFYLFIYFFNVVFLTECFQFGKHLQCSSNQPCWLELPLPHVDVPHMDQRGGTKLTCFFPPICSVYTHRFCSSSAVPYHCYWLTALAQSSRTAVDYLLNKSLQVSPCCFTHNM